MREKNDIEVLINGRKYTICGYESEEYMQKIASYINATYSKLRSKDQYNSLDMDLRNVLIQINVADDYYKAQKRVNELESEMELKEKMLFDLKHELITLQSRLDESEALSKEWDKKCELAEKEIVKLQTQLNTKGVRNNR